MTVDKDLANFEIQWISRDGDTGKGWAEHRSLLLMFIHNHKK